MQSDGGIMVEEYRRCRDILWWDLEKIMKEGGVAAVGWAIVILAKMKEEIVEALAKIVALSGGGTRSIKATSKW